MKATASVMLLAVFAVLDNVLTLGALQIGVSEANPINGELIQKVGSAVWFLSNTAVKLCFITVLHAYGASLAIVMLTWMYGFVILFHITSLGLIWILC